MKQQNDQRRYYERFQVEDVINFFSGQLLQAKSSDGAQVFLQSIKTARRPLPNGYRDALRKLQHPHLAPILDVMEEEEQIILVHPPFSGDPLPLIVNKTRAMEPEKAVRIAAMLFRTLTDLERLPLPMSATLDPKNILLNGQTPILLFYYVKDEKQEAFDQKWRQLLFYLLTGHEPTGGPNHCEKQLEAKRVPAKIIRLALLCLDREVTYSQALQAIEQHVTSNEWSESTGLRRNREKRSRKKLYTTVSIATAALVLITIAVSNWGSGNSSASDDPFKEALASQQDNKEVKGSDLGLIQSFSFSKDKKLFTLPFSLQGDSNVRGEFMLEKLNGFVGYLETKDQSAAYGVQVDKQGKVILFQKAGDKTYRLGDSGDLYRIKPGKKYTFDIYYLPGQPLRISLAEEGQANKWVAVGTSPVDEQLKMHFYGSEGATLFLPQFSPITDRSMVDSVWMNGQPWHLDFGQGILKTENGTNHLEVFTKSQVRLGITGGTTTFFFIPPEKGDPLYMDIQVIDGSRYRLVWEETNHLTLFYLQDKMKRIKQERINWKPSKDEPVQVTVHSAFNELNIQLTQGSNMAEIKHTHDDPIPIQDIILRNSRSFGLIEGKALQQNEASDVQDRNE